jgi:hypothetical protein
MDDIDTQYEALTTVPDDSRSRIPDRGCTVAELLAARIPSTAEWAHVGTIVSELLVTEEPNVNADEITGMDVLSQSFIDQVLAALMSQLRAGIYGTRSIRHPTLPNVYLPLWAPRLMRSLHENTTEYRGWMTSREFLRTHAATSNAASRALDALDLVVWGSSFQVPGTRTFAPVANLRALVTPDGLHQESWLVDDVLDFGTGHLRNLLSRHDAEQTTTRIENIAFYQYISTRVGTSRSRTPSLSRSRFLQGMREFRSGGGVYVYFIVNVNDDHWVTYCINYSDMTISSGMHYTLCASSPISPSSCRGFSWRHRTP